MTENAKSVVNGVKFLEKEINKEEGGVTCVGLMVIVNRRKVQKFDNGGDHDR